MALLAEPRTATLDPMEPVPFKVRGIRDELEDTFTLELEPPEGRFEFKPGQYTMLYSFGIGEVPISVSGDASRPSRLVQTIRGVGAVTRALRNVRPGDVVGVRGPFGTPWPVHEATGRDIVFVAGGIGLAPLRPAIYRVLERRDHYGQVVVLYGARSPRELLFSEELQDWGGRFDVTVLVTVDNADRAWFGSVGVVTKLVPRAPYEPPNAAAFVCGPEIMMRFTGQELASRGVAPDQIFVSMERNMKCGVGFCGHCQFATKLVCRDGPVFPYSEVARLLTVREV
jgi:NAD(P)H-flavin reductase